MAEAQAGERGHDLPVTHGPRMTDSCREQGLALKLSRWAEGKTSEHGRAVRKGETATMETKTKTNQGHVGHLTATKTDTPSLWRYLYLCWNLQGMLLTCLITLPSLTALEP